MDAIPLLSHASADAIVAYRGGVSVTAQQFIDDAAHLEARLPSGRHVLNMCVDRYRFAVGLAACLLSGRVSLLPSTHTPVVIRQLATFATDAFCLTDEPTCDIALPQMRYVDALHLVAPACAAPSLAWSAPRIPADQLAAIVFTSGSTGTPLPYRKTWGPVAHCVRAEAERLGLDDGRAHTLIGTVPPQHMYGFESTVLLALLSGNALAAERPFYPADICTSIAQVPRPRALISTPVHLHTLLASEVSVPPLDLVVSATAPLSTELARKTEQALQTHLLEIYGSTETGQIATRRTAVTAVWRLWPNVRLTMEGGRVRAVGGHIEQPTSMGDVIEMQSDTEFLLHGRTADMINIAGKRSSFGYLNTLLNGIPGVIDGAFFLRESDSAETTGITRLAAVVVAPGLDLVTLTAALRQLIDPVYLPRPLILVDTLPRNATGKLPQQELQSLAERHLKTVGSV